MQRNLPQRDDIPARLVIVACHQRRISVWLATLSACLKRDISTRPEQPNLLDRKFGFSFGGFMAKIETSGLYIIDDQFFLDYPNDRYMWNKGEARPHYYAVQDGNGIFWMIPLSTKVDKYRIKIADTEARHGNGSCFMYHLAQIHGQERAVLICDMFPVTEKYILRPYTIGGSPYVIRNETIRKGILKKAKRYLSMVKRGQLWSPLNILETREKLIQTQRSQFQASQIRPL